MASRRKGKQNRRPLPEETGNAYFGETVYKPNQIRRFRQSGRMSPEEAQGARGTYREWDTALNRNKADQLGSNFLMFSPYTDPGQQGFNAETGLVDWAPEDIVARMQEIQARKAALLGGGGRRVRPPGFGEPGPGGSTGPPGPIMGNTSIPRGAESDPVPLPGMGTSLIPTPGAGPNAPNRNAPLGYHANQQGVVTRNLGRRNQNRGGGLLDNRMPDSGMPGPRTGRRLWNPRRYR
jgi:hypothetical protein